MATVVPAGGGFTGRMHAHVYASLEGARLGGVVDRDPDRAGEMARDFGVPPFATMEEALAATDPTAVDVCRPTDLHRDFTVRALRAGSHGLGEKPMAGSVDDADAMVPAAQTADRQLMVGHCIRLWPEEGRRGGRWTPAGGGRRRTRRPPRADAVPVRGRSSVVERRLVGRSEARGRRGAGHAHPRPRLRAASVGRTGSGGRRRGGGPSQPGRRPQAAARPGLLGGGGRRLDPSPVRAVPPEFPRGTRAVRERGAILRDGGPRTIYREDGTTETPECERMAAPGGRNIDDLGGHHHELKDSVDRLAAGEPIAVADGVQARNTLAWPVAGIGQIAARRG